jgi:membrane protein YqaA with SNARE-associated domain
MGVALTIAALWGFFEATVFFIVPDVWISAIAMRRGWKAGALAASVACFGALLGGFVMYLWGSRNIEAARQFLDLIPAISPAMVAGAGEDLRLNGLIVMLTGAFTGVPFKIYAVEAGALKGGLIPFLMMAFAARLTRFVLAALIAAAAAQGLRRSLSERTILLLLAAFWVSFYAWYFAVTG